MKTEKIIIKGFSDIYPSAAAAVSNAGRQILKRPKYASRIKSTIISANDYGTCKYAYLDENNEIVAVFMIGRTDEVIVIGEKILADYEIELEGE